MTHLRDVVSASGTQRAAVRGASSRFRAAVGALALGLLVLAAPAFGAVSAIGTPTSLFQSTAGPVHTLSSVSVPAGTSRVLVVVASHAGFVDVASVTFNGQAMTKVIERDDTVAVDSIWYRALGDGAGAVSGDVVATFATPTTITPIPTNSFIAAAAFSGVNQGSPISASLGGNNSAGTNLGSTLNVTSAVGDIVLDVFDGFRSSTGAVSLTAGGGQSPIASGGGPIASGNVRYSVSTKPGEAPNASMSWTSNAEAYIHLVANVRAAPAPVMINELDSDTPGTDVAEFIELYDGGVGNTPLDGLVLVLYNGSNDLSYLAFDLDGRSTDAGGYFVLCGNAANVANCDLDVTPDTDLIQNGQDAAALYTANAADFPLNTPVTTTNLVDALVYDTSDADDPGLLVLLNAGQPQVDENANTLGATQSNQRCPNGSGGARNTSTYRQTTPSPGIANTCPGSITLTQSGGSTNVAEGGATDTYTLVLNTQPTADVSIAINPGAQLTVATSPVVFTNTNWATPQTVTVTAVNDTFVEGAHTGTIAHTVSSTDAGYNGLSVPNVVANIADNDVASVSFTGVDTATSLSESSTGGDSYTVQITSTPASGSAVVLMDPDADCEISIDGSAFGSSGTITIANPSTIFNIVMRAVNDRILEGTHNCSVSYGFSASTAPEYASLSRANDVYAVTDNEIAIFGLVRADGTISNSTTASEAVTSAAIGMLLQVDYENASTGTVGIDSTFSIGYSQTGGTATGGGVDYSFTNGAVTFTPADTFTDAGGYANLVKPISFTVVDDAIAEATETVIVTADADESGTSGSYDAVITLSGGGFGTHTYNITNNDTAGVTRAESGGSTDVTEGGATDSYTLVLTSQPTSPVTIAVSGGAQLTATPPTLTFTASDWNLPQTVTVTAVDDAAVEGAHTGTITHTASSVDAAYQGISVPNVVANISDNDLAALSINDVSVVEGNAGTVTATFTVSLSSPAGAGGVSFDIATANNTATTANNDYVSNSLTGQTIAAGNSSYNFSVTVNGDITSEANETFFVNVTNVTGATVGDGQGIGTITNDDVALTPIHDIQGPGASSPIVGASVTTRGIVTGVKSNGYFIQEPDASVDADPATSEGIFVFTSSAPPAAAVVGNLVQVSGTVSEFVPAQDPLQPPYTQLTGSSTLQVSAGNPLPAPVSLSATFPDPAGPHDQLERVEGMRVAVASLTVAGPTFGTTNEVTATATSNGVFHGVVTGLPRPFREAGIQAPDPAPDGTVPPIPRFDSNPERIRVDSDGLVGGPVIDVGAGAVVTNLVGPLEYASRAYTILPDTGASLGVSGGPTAAATAAPVNTEITVASYNLDRLFDDVDDPALSEPVLTTTAFNNRLAKASLGIRNFMRTPDILGVAVVENLSTLQALATRINNDAVAASQPNPLYQAFLIEGNEVAGSDIGFLVKSAIVSGTTPRVEVVSVQQVLDGSLFTSPDSSTEPLHERPPLVLDAIVHHPGGASYPLVVIQNHLRSLDRISSPDPGTNGWPTEGARVRAKRLDQAEDLANYVQSRQTADPSERMVVLGDFNAFEVNDGMVDSMGVIAGTPVPDNQTAVPGDGIDLVNPDLDNLVDTRPAGERYSAVADGDAQSLDHVLANAPLLASTSAARIEHARINADFPLTDRNNAATARRMSSRDPVVAYFTITEFAGADLSITKTNGTTSSTPGASTTYTIVASNAGPSNAGSATVTDTFPASLTCNWTCTGAGGGSCPASGSGNINQTVNLPSGGSVTYTASCTISAGATGTLSNTATVSSSLADPTPGNNSATDSDTLTPQADIGISKTDGQASVNAGSDAVYTITASNAGPSHAPTATLTDTFPAVCVSPTWTCAGAGGGSCAASGSGNISQGVNLPAGGSVTFTATCPVSAAASGTLSNTATVTAGSGVTDPNPGNNSATDTSTVIAVPVLSINSVGLTEGDSGSSNLQFVVTRSTTGTAFTVDYATADGSANAGSDYTQTTGTLSFTAGGAATQTIDVPITGDNRVEASEGFTLTLSNPSGTAQIGTATGTGTITDNDSAVVGFSPVGVSQTEGSSPMVYTVTLSNPVQSGVTVTANSAFGTASAADFTAIVGATVSFAPNSTTSQALNVTVTNDALDEDDETFTLNLSGLSATGNVTLGAAAANGTVLDDDLSPVISVTSPSQLEGDASQAPLNFVVSLSAVSGRDVSFTRATADITATVANNDYLPLAPASVTIPAGQTSTSIAVQILGDTAFEGDETFSLNLSGVSNATPSSLSGTGTIVEDDQQPTTTTITSDTPDPSVVGQPYAVAVNVAAVSSAPAGTVTISDGSSSCGPVNLTASTASSSTASCSLASTTAGARTLTASYAPASAAFAASSGTAAHQVDAATTAISVSGPPRSRINQPVSFTFALSVNAPGAGSPAGTVTLSSGAATCSVTLPTVTPSCALTFNALGSRTITAVFAPSDGNFSAASSSGAGNAQTLVFAQSDIAVTKSDGLATYEPGDLVVYTVTVRNLGADAAAQIRVVDNVPAGLVNVVWSCDASGGVACPSTGGSGSLDVTVPSFPVGGLLSFTFYGNVDGSPAQLANTAQVQLPADTTIEDLVPGNNSATDTNLLDRLFANGFESAAVNAQGGNFRLPGISLRSVLDEVALVVYRLDDANGEALRVYARVIDGELQFALATRNAQGRLRLGAWARYTGEPLLTWTARAVAEGWVLESAGLQ